MVAPTIFQPTLLDCWQCRDLKRFRLVLKGSGGIVIGEKQQYSLSSSNPRSPGFSLGSAGNHGISGPCSPAEVNRRDHLGRTVLHLLATSIEPVSIDYLTALLAHPSVNLNLQDHENGWTPLHRALYHGNLLTALTLLKKSPPADLRVKDSEGLTPFDLYNSTVHGTNPTSIEEEGGELYTWGANRNYTLGLGNSDDRALPDRVNLRRNDGEENSGRSQEPGSIYDRIKIKDVAMNKFATVVLTAERHSNVWVCGIGTNGRIGRSPQTQTNLEPLRDFSETASSIAVGPDHTCILTSNGEVYSFGCNRFYQLGYTLENGQGIVSSTGSARGTGGAATATFGAASNNIPNSELDVQITPRKVVGQLKREQVLGIAAGKLHSAAFTANALYTWGTNTGQLGYDRAATPVQLTPRRVTSVTSNQRIQMIAVTDFATACLFANGDVLLLHNDTSFFVRFPPPGFSSDIDVFRPRQARPKPSIQKVIAGPNNAFAAISDMGDMWQFNLEHPSEYAQPSGSTVKANIKPQLIWSVRKNKKIGAAKDVALGSGSDLILVTESGHVFVRSKRVENGVGNTVNQSGGGAGGGKGKSGWRPVPFLQRVSKVMTNESGGLAAIKSNARIREIRIRGKSLHEDLQDFLPHLKAYSSTNAKEEESTIVGNLAEANVIPTSEESEQSSPDEDSDVENSGQRYIAMAQKIAEAARRWTGSSEDSQRYGPHNVHLPPFGSDMFLIAGNRYLPVHRAIFSARLPALAKVLENPPIKGTGTGLQGVIVRRVGKAVTLTLEGCSFGTALFLLHYLYTDDLPPIWTASVGIPIEKLYASLKLQPSLIHSQLKQLADILKLPALRPSLNSPVPTPPSATLSADLTSFFISQVETPIEQSPHHDVELHFADRIVPAHSVLLRRSPFFAALFQPEWTSTRWSKGIINIDMSHIRWEVARIVLLHLYTDEQGDLFAGSENERTQDQYIDFIFEVLAFSNEILLIKLKLICSALLRKRILHSNIAAILSDADFYHAISLKDAIMEYIAKVMESLLESGSLDGLEPRLIKDLTQSVRAKQDERMHRSARDNYMQGLITKHQDFFFDLDLPPPSLGVAAAKVPKRQSRSSPSLGPTRSVNSRNGGRKGNLGSSPTNSPYLRPLQGLQGGANNDSNLLMFSMDDDAETDGGEWQSVSQGGSRNRGNRSPSFEDNSHYHLTSARQPSATPWKSRTVEAEKATPSPIGTPPSNNNTSFDLKSIMAAEQRRGGRPSNSPSVTPNGSITPNRPMSVTPADLLSSVPVQSAAKMSQRDRKRQLLLQGQSAVPSASPLSPPTSTSISSALVSPWNTPAKASTPLRPNVAPLQSPPTATTMGPTYTPSRVSSKPFSQKWVATSNAAETISGSIWSSTNIAGVSGSSLGSSPANRASDNNVREIPLSPVLGPDLNATGLPIPAKSFAEIQAEELKRYEQVNAQTSTKSKSFAELQEEDRLENERRKEEERKKEEFEKWFEEESKRLKQQEQQHQSGRGKGRPAALNSSRRGKAGKAKKKAEDESMDTNHPSNSTSRGDHTPSRGKSRAKATQIPSQPGQTET